MTRVGGGVLVALCAVGVGLGDVGRAEARSLQTGFGGSEYLSPVPEMRASWLDRTVAANASFIRVPVSWRHVAPVQRPPGFDPRDPADPAYEWAAGGDLDGAVRSARARGLEVLLTVARAPDWAQGAGMPPGTEPGSWRPSPGHFAAFATAVARRYSGRFDDGSGVLPRVRYYQAWNEPNLALYLSPQWKRRKPQSPAIYRPLLNSFYDAVKGVSRANVVITAGTAPNGDRPGNDRMRPLRFWRRVFCLRGKRLRRMRKCPARTRLDVLAHHPIGGGPRRHAAHRDDLAFPDFRRLRRVLRRGRKTKRVRPAGPKPIWATEFFWDTDPPDSFGIPERRQARWIADGLYTLWRQRVGLAVLLQIRDALPPTPTPQGYADSLQTGVYFHNGEPKLGLRAMRFPFVAERRRKRVRVWGVAPSSGTLVVERRRRSGWRRVKRIRVRSRAVFVGRVRRPAGVYRARLGQQISLERRVRRSVRRR